MCANFLISFELAVGLLLGTVVLVDDGPVALAGGGPDGRTDPVDTDGSPELELSWQLCGHADSIDTKDVVKHVLRLPKQLSGLDFMSARFATAWSMYSWQVFKLCHLPMTVVE